MHRFYLPTAPSQGRELLLPEPEAHHAVRVLRIQPDERVIVLDGLGGEYLCRVADIHRREVRLHVLEHHFIPPLPFQTILVQAVAKGKAMDWIVQKAAELGAFELVPLLAERSVPQIDGEHTSAKIEKWQAIGVEALKQCGSAWLPRISLPTTPRDYLASSAGETHDLVLIAALHRDAKHPREYFQQFQAQENRPPKSVAVWIGPEGDFTLEELEAARAAGALPISLGRLTLRAETAAVYCLSIIQYELLWRSAGAV